MEAHAPQDGFEALVLHERIPARIADDVAKRWLVPLARVGERDERTIVLAETDQNARNFRGPGSSLRRSLLERVRGVPDLVIEILSPSTRKVDEVIKRRLFDRVGAKEYWVVDHELEAIRVFRRARDGSFPRVAEPTSEQGDTLTTPLLPDFTIAMRELFRP